MSRSFEEVCIDLELAESEIDRLKAELEELNKHLHFWREESFAGQSKRLEMVDRFNEAQRQLAEARAKNKRLNERLQANGAKIDDEDVVIEWTDYLKLKAEARQEAAMGILHIISMETMDRPFEQSQAAEIIKAKFKLEG